MQNRSPPTSAVFSHAFEPEPHATVLDVDLESVLGFVGVAVDPQALGFELHPPRHCFLGLKFEVHSLTLKWVLNSIRRIDM